VHQPRHVRAPALRIARRRHRAACPQPAARPAPDVPRPGPRRLRVAARPVAGQGRGGGVTVATKWDIVRDEWLDYVDAVASQAEEATRGYLLNPEHRDEFLRKYGSDYVAQGLFSDMTSAAAYYYASEELVDWWREHPRQTWP